MMEVDSVFAFYDLDFCLQVKMGIKEFKFVFCN